jgi:Protein of unknown function (DUF3107)
MEIRIGIVNSSRELTLDSDDTTDVIQETVRKALADSAPLVLKDRRKRQVLIPVDKLAYIEFGDPLDRKVGFGIS